MRGINHYHSDLLFHVAKNHQAIVAAGLPAESPRDWLYSDNNSFVRYKLYELANTTVDRKKLDAEVAVFSGNLFRLILGGAHPIYYACEIVDAAGGKPHGYVRVCNKIPDYSDWEHIVSVHEDRINIAGKEILFNSDEVPVHGLTAILVMGFFLNEEDWNGTNFGLTRNFEAVRIDPGLSFGDKFFSGDIQEIQDGLNNLLKNFIWNIEGGEYLTEFKPGCANEQMPPLVNRLFNSQSELFATLAGIISMPSSLYYETALQCFSKEHSLLGLALAQHIKARIRLFYEAAKELDGFNDYFIEYLNKHSGEYLDRLKKLQGRNEFRSGALKDRLEADIIVQMRLCRRAQSTNENKTLLTAGLFHASAQGVNGKESGNQPCELPSQPQLPPLKKTRISTFGGISS